VTVAGGSFWGLVPSYINSTRFDMTIAELESKIRDRINRGRMQHELLGRSADWNKLCSALDVVGDTELALDAYLKHPEIKSTGLCYVHVYGALQLLQLQQDAVDHICRALRITAKNSPKLPHIRKIRNSSVGHPFA
jgi:cellobiose phosphorylase